MRELFRTDEGMAAWRNPATDAQSRRLLGALVQPQPESHLKLVLGTEGEILLDSLVRRGWVAWRDLTPEEPQKPQEGHEPSSPDLATETDPAAPKVSPESSQTEDVITPTPTPPTADSLPPGVYLPPLKAPPPASREEIDKSLDEFFRKMGM